MFRRWQRHWGIIRAQGKRLSEKLGSHRAEGLKFWLELWRQGVFAYKLETTSANWAQKYAECEAGYQQKVDAMKTHDNIWKLRRLDLARVGRCFYSWRRELARIVAANLAAEKLKKSFESGVLGANFMGLFSASLDKYFSVWRRTAQAFREKQNLGLALFDVRDRAKAFYHKQRLFDAWQLQAQHLKLRNQKSWMREKQVVQGWEAVVGKLLAANMEFSLFGAAQALAQQREAKQAQMVADFRDQLNAVNGRHAAVMAVAEKLNERWDGGFFGKVSEILVSEILIPVPQLGLDGGDFVVWDQGVGREYAALVYCCGPAPFVAPIDRLLYTCSHLVSASLFSAAVPSTFEAIAIRGTGKQISAGFLDGARQICPGQRIADEQRQPRAQVQPRAQPSPARHA